MEQKKLGKFRKRYYFRNKRFYNTATIDIGRQSSRDQKHNMKCILRKTALAKKLITVAHLISKSQVSSCRFLGNAVQFCVRSRLKMTYRKVFSFILGHYIFYTVMVCTSHSNGETNSLWFSDQSVWVHRLV